MLGYAGFQTAFVPALSFVCVPNNSTMALRASAPGLASRGLYRAIGIDIRPLDMLLASRSSFVIFVISLSRSHVLRQSTDFGACTEGEIPAAA